MIKFVNGADFYKTILQSRIGVDFYLGRVLQIALISFSWLPDKKFIKYLAATVTVLL